MEPVEVVISGIGGLFPDSQDVDEFREHLLRGKSLASTDAVRWPPGALGAPHRVTNVKNAYKFDNNFYAIHRRLAEVIDPAAKLMFERTVEAIMDAGLDPEELDGSDTHVYTANWVSEAETLGSMASPHTYFIMGTNKSMVPNRISFFLNLTGTSCVFGGDWTVGMTALQRASRAIRDGQCDAAIVGAAGMAFRPGVSKLLQGIGLLSDDGSCRPFSQDGQGGARGESVVVMLLQRADKARRVYANLAAIGELCLGQRDTMLLPSVDLMKAFLRDLYHGAGVDPRDVVAAHATGVGQPELDGAELDAVADVLCSSRSSALPVFSAAGVAGLADVASPLLAVVAAAIALEAGLVPPVQTDSADRLLQPLRDGTLEVSSRPRPLSVGPQGALAVSCVGLSGSVGHVVLRPCVPRAPEVAVDETQPRLIVAQGRSEQQVEDVLRRIAEAPLQAGYIRLTQDMFCSRKYLSYECRAFAVLPAAEGRTLDVKVGRLSGDRPLWLVYSGMGSQWTGMGRGLMLLPTFASTVERLHAVLQPHGVDLKRVLTDDDPAVFDNILHAFVGIAAVQIGLTNVLRDLEVHIDGMVGHSVGELGCSYADGCLTEEQTILAAHARGRASLEATLVPGVMCAVGLGYEEVQPLLPASVDVACHNSEDNCTLSGPAEDMKVLVKDLQDRGIFARMVNVANIAYHSRYIRPAAPLLLEYLKKVIPEAKERSSRWVSSSVSAARVDDPHARLCSAEYHTNNLLSTVFFEEAFRAVPENAVVLEVAPHGLLQAVIRRMLPEGGCSIPLTRRAVADQRRFLLEAVGSLFLEGIAARVSALSPGVSPALPSGVSLPVPRGTPSTANLATWDHGEEWLDFKRDFASAIMERGVTFTLLPLEAPIMSVRGVQYCPAAFILERVWRETAQAEPLERCPVVFENLFLSSILLSENLENDLTLRIQWLSSTGSFEVSRHKHGRDLAEWDSVGWDCVLRGRVRRVQQADLQVLLTATPEEPYRGAERLRLDSEQLYDELADRGLEFDAQLKTLQGAVVYENEWRADCSLSSGWGAFLCALLQLHHLAIDGKVLGQGALVGAAVRRIVLDPSRLQGSGGGTVAVRQSLVLGSVHGDGVRVDGVRVLRGDWHQGDQAASLHFVHYSAASGSERDVVRDACCLALENGLDVGRSLVVLEVTEPRGTRPVQRPVQRLALDVQRALQDEAGEATSVAVLPVDSVDAVPSSVRGCCVLVVADEGALSSGTAMSVLERAAVGRSPSSPRLLLVRDPRPRDQLVILAEHRGTEHTLQLLVQTAAVAVPELRPQVTLCSGDELAPEALVGLGAGPLWLVWRSRPLAGVMAAVASARDRPYAAHIKLIFILDPEAPPFSADSPLYADQMRLGLAVNVLQGGRWGSMRLRNLEDVLDAAPTPAPTSRTESGVRFLALGPEEDATGGALDYCGDLAGRRVLGVARASHAGPRPDDVLQWTVPDSWSSEDAVSVPSAYATAYHALSVLHRGRVPDTRTALVLDATLVASEAAIRVASHLGLRAFTTTASTTAGGAARVLRRLPFLRGRHVLPEERFEVELRVRTHGRGADVVFCPDGQDVAAALRCVAPYGLLVLLGGHRQFQGRSIDTIQFLRNVRVCRGGPAALLSANSSTRQAVADAMQIGIAEGAVRPLPAPPTTQRGKWTGAEQLGTCLVVGHCAAGALTVARSLTSAGWPGRGLALAVDPKASTLRRANLLPSPPTLLPCPHDAAETDDVLSRASALTGTLGAVVILASSETVDPLVRLLHEAVCRRHPETPLVVLSDAESAPPLPADTRRVLHLHGPLRAAARVLPNLLLQRGVDEIVVREVKQEWPLLTPRLTCGGGSARPPPTTKEGVVELPTLAARLCTRAASTCTPRREPVPLIAVLGADDTDLDMRTLEAVAQRLMSPMLVIAARAHGPEELAREVLRVQPHGPWAFLGGTADGSLLASVAHLLSPPAPTRRSVPTPIAILDRRGLWPKSRILREKLKSCSGIDFAGPLQFLKISHENRTTLKMSETCYFHTLPEDGIANVINEHVLSLPYMVPATCSRSM